MKKVLLVICAFLLLVACNQSTVSKVLVSNDAQLKMAIKNATAGDNIVLKNGTYY